MEEMTSTLEEMREREAALKEECDQLMARLHASRIETGRAMAYRMMRAAPQDLGPPTMTVTRSSDMSAEQKQRLKEALEEPAKNEQPPTANNILPDIPAARSLMQACDFSPEPCFMPPGTRLKLTPEQIAARGRQIHAALAAGVDINGHYKGANYTFLTCAVSAGNASIVKMLLDAGADPNKADPVGLRPYQTAEKRGFQDIKALLVQAGADASLPPGPPLEGCPVPEGCAQQ